MDRRARPDQYHACSANDQAAPRACLNCGTRSDAGGRAHLEILARHQFGGGQKTEEDLPELRADDGEECGEERSQDCSIARGEGNGGAEDEAVRPAHPGPDVPLVEGMVFQHARAAAYGRTQVQEPATPKTDHDSKRTVREHDCVRLFPSFSAYCSLISAPCAPFGLVGFG